MVKTTKPGYYASHPKKYGEYSLLKASKDTDTIIARKAKHNLLVDNEPFLISIIGNWLSPNSYFLFPELIQESRLAFLTAIERYDLAKDVSIRSYAKYYILKVKNSFFKKALYVELKEKDLEEEYILPDFDTKYTNLQSILNEAINCLNPSERTVIKLRFYDGFKGRAIAVLRGISEARVSKLLSSALRKLKDYFINKGLEIGMLQYN